MYFKNTDPDPELRYPDLVCTDPRFYYPDSDPDTPDILFSERIRSKSQAYLSYDKIIDYCLCVNILMASFSVGKYLGNSSTSLEKCSII